MGITTQINSVEGKDFQSSGFQLLPKGPITIFVFTGFCAEPNKTQKKKFLKINEDKKKERKKRRTPPRKQWI